MNKGNNLWKFGPNDRFVEKQAYEILQIMQSVNMTDEVMVEYLNDRGIYFKNKKVFKDPMEGMVQSVAGNPRSKDTAPSRVGKGTGEANNENATVTTREDQIKKVQRMGSVQEKYVFKHERIEMDGAIFWRLYMYYPAHGRVEVIEVPQVEHEPQTEEPEVNIDAILAQEPGPTELREETLGGE